MYFILTRGPAGLGCGVDQKGGASLGLLRRRGSPVFGERDFGDEPGCLDRLRGFFRHAADLAFLAGVDVRRPEPGGKFHFGRRRRVHEGQHEGVLVVPGVMVRDDRQPTLARRVFPLVPPLEAERPGLRTRHDRMRAVYFCRGVQAHARIVGEYRDRQAAESSEAEPDGKEHPALVFGEEADDHHDPHVGEH